MTANEIRQAYSPAAEWVPCGRAVPPAGEYVRVLYADGIVAVGYHAGGALYRWDNDTCRYVEAFFWQPVLEAT